MDTLVFYENKQFGFFYIDPSTKNYVDEFRGRGSSESGWRLDKVVDRKCTLEVVLKSRETPRRRVPKNWLNVLLQTRRSK